jgi:hypothetical protein
MNIMLRKLEQCHTFYVIEYRPLSTTQEVSVQGVCDFCILQSTQFNFYQENITLISKWLKF